MNMKSISEIEQNTIFIADIHISKYILIHNICNALKQTKRLFLDSAFFFSLLLTAGSFVILQKNMPVFQVKLKEKLDGVALLIRDPPPTSSTTFSSTMQSQDMIQNGISRLQQDKIQNKIRRLQQDKIQNWIRRLYQDKIQNGIRRLNPRQKLNGISWL